MVKAQLKTGMLVDGFRIGERINRGGMASIRRVTHSDSAAPMVMKVPFLDFEGDITLIVGFEVEQMIMAELKGPHVPRLVRNGDFAVLPYIAMEYIDGPTLLDKMEKSLSIPEVREIAIAVATALSDLHRQNVLHLDLKPANILFRPTGEAVLIDFGLSRHLLLPDLLQEQFHRPTGTPNYMAPEQLLSVRSDRRSDIFAFGAMIYQAATGSLPFGNASKLSTVRQRVWRRPIAPRSLRPDMPKELQEVILKCIEPIPDERYPDMENLLFDLRHPELVDLTERADRVQKDDIKVSFERWRRASRIMQEVAERATKSPPAQPIIVVLVDIPPTDVETAAALQDAAASVLANVPGARLACADVITTSLFRIDEPVNADGENIQVKRLAQLRKWADPLQLPKGLVSFHLLEGRSIANAVLDFTRSNNAVHLLVAAPDRQGNSSGRARARIAAEAPCAVTVVR